MIRVVLVVALGFFPLAARAQGLVLGATPPAPPPQNCTSVTVGGVVSYGCTAGQQPTLLAQHQANLAATAPNARSAPTTLGLYNQAATRQTLGSNFGRSTHPQQIPPSNYMPKLGPH